MDGRRLRAVASCLDDSHLLYVGRSENVRTRIHEYLAAKRPNETLCLRLVDQVIRPDMTADPRGVIEIAVACLRGCRFAAWQSDGRHSLSAVEATVLNRGVHGEMPLLNRPALRRRLVQSPRAVAGA